LAALFLRVVVVFFLVIAQMFLNVHYTVCWLIRKLDAATY
jgi:hypothetical protein